MYYEQKSHIICDKVSVPKIKDEPIHKTFVKMREIDFILISEEKRDFLHGDDSNFLTGLFGTKL